MQNNNCSGAGPCQPQGEVRTLPCGTKANMIFCIYCFAREINWRIKENKRLAKEFQYEIPNWDDLEVYSGHVEK